MHNATQSWTGSNFTMFSENTWALGLFHCCVFAPQCCTRDGLLAPTLTNQGDGILWIAPGGDQMCNYIHLIVVPMIQSIWLSSAFIPPCDFNWRSSWCCVRLWQHHAQIFLNLPLGLYSHCHYRLHHLHSIHNPCSCSCSMACSQGCRSDGLLATTAANLVLHTDSCHGSVLLSHNIPGSYPCLMTCFCVQPHGKEPVGLFLEPPRGQG